MRWDKPTKPTYEDSPLAEAVRARDYRQQLTALPDSELETLSRTTPKALASRFGISKQRGRQLRGDANIELTRRSSNAPPHTSPFATPSSATV